MSFLRRMFGGGSGGDAGQPIDAATNDGASAIDDAERDRQLAREDAERTADELIARQLRYADRAWTPPAQGGTRRADDAEDGDADHR
jgi:hypothetical protein